MRHNLALVLLMIGTFVAGFFSREAVPTLSIGAFVTSGLALVAVLVLNSISYMYPPKDD